ncbi:hypothetical protein MHB77_32090 [Paenibacillus sp. FSL K6-3166]|uniref:hypothetical protein n=1 Tax=unclassified Paenibacillus TaxID=185978 RepID=UPI000BA023B8|nr:hypothetical protein [Paenibacillus sp. VTT E-133291]OZQ81183.1 hypothetical protein CA598_27080 [Paenibacillus sp. VTT E-133291]
MLKKVKKWVRNEQSASLTTENGMLMLGGIALAVGATFLVSQYLKPTGETVLSGMEATATSGISPDTATDNVSGWGRTN